MAGTHVYLWLIQVNVWQKNPNPSQYCKVIILQLKLINFFKKTSKCCACVLSHIQLYVTPWTFARQSPLSVEFTRKEYWSGWPLPPPWDKVFSCQILGVNCIARSESEMKHFFLLTFNQEAKIFLVFFLFLFLFFKYWFICWVFVAARAFSSCSKRGILSSSSLRASCCGGLWAPECRLSGFGSRA